MENRALAAQISSLISELIIILIAGGDSLSSPINSLSPFLINNFLSLSQITTSLSILSHKRKRPESPQPEKPTKLTRWVESSHSFIPRNPDSFKLCFNMTSSTFEWLSALLEPLLECRDPVNSPLNLPVETRLGIGVFRLATGSDYVEVSRRFNVSEHVAKFCVNQFCRVLCTDFRFWVEFPSPNELGPVSESFERLTGLPNCCGVIHCTRFNMEIQEHIAAQIVVDSSSKILSIVAGFNGKKSNHLVLKSSSLYKDIESNALLNSQPLDINGVSIPQYLIGDQGYPSLPWLMVPFDRPVVNSYEENFNSAHKLMMGSGFRTVDSLKKWGVLSKPSKEEIKTTVAYIAACSILHNALLIREDYSSLSEKLDDYSLYSDASEYQIDDVSFLHSSSEQQKALDIRNALATRARRYVRG
ncbi:protein ANTAGONIST OF LIKE HETEROCHROMATIN PROTEIN 1-like [Rutidosis leptorrhynchoides]|uniref:protein ANTAGONIST OF LIKE HETEROCHROMATIN PROTEIN 1-like n=1 Tax=Rutidosis leptorrhynchoides TaxID=125765 RepID=UPI003A9A5FA6